MANSVEYSLNKAKSMLRKGQVAEAKKTFQSILVAFPENPRAQDGLRSCEEMQLDRNSTSGKMNSNVIHQLYLAGEHEEVVRLAKQYTVQHPNDAEMLLKLGASLAILGKFSEALDNFYKAQALEPNNAAPFNNIGTLYKMQDNIELAIEFYEKALEKDGSHFDSLRNLAFCLQTSGNEEQATKYFKQAVTVKPQAFELLNHLGSSLSKQGFEEEAQVYYTKALEVKPDFNPSINNLGNIYYHRQEFEKAIELYETAIANDSEYADAYNNLANVLKDMGYLDEAVSNYEKAIELNPSKAELHSNHAVVLKDKFELERALVAVEKAIELKEDFNDAHWNKALIQLSGKNYKDGWINYDWRWKATNFDSTFLNSSNPLWSGNKERVLIWQEQGIGDQIMFSTLFEEFANFCSLPIFQVDRRLLPIFRRTFPQFHFIPGDKKLDENEYDSHIPMGSMCKYLRTSETDFISARPSKLKADLVTSQKIRQSFRIGNKTLVGISWRSMNKATGLMRSLSLTEFLEPFKNKDVEIVNLQYGDCKKEIAEAFEKTGVAVKSINEIDTFTNIDHLASLIQACDRVITIDNSTVHLSASMGKPTDLLLPFITDWRWCGGEKIPMWYDCLTVHRAPYGFHIRECIKQLIESCFSE